MTSKQLLIPVLAGVLALPVALRADDERLKTAETVLREMAGASDKGVAEGLIQKAKCIVIIPGVKKGAIGVGGQYGRGYISCRKDGGSGWSAPGGDSHRGREHRLADRRDRHRRAHARHE